MSHMLVTMDIDNSLVAVLAMGVGGFIVVTAIVFDAIRKMVQTSSREKSRREIAAYIAEGTITPQDGERLIEAGRRYEKGCGLGN